ncbi:MAG: UDP-N-acetylmuramate dehydrogenase [Saprospiraceae bacterium]|nr:UDP-N-acetylmuramate dehydrogenase [Saprospiraceae bacterium]
MKILHNTDLQPFNTFNINSIAAEIFVIESMDDFENNLKFPLKNIKIWGGGSNILLTQPQSDTILKIETKGKNILQENDNEAIVKVAAGENWHQFVLWSLENKLYGLENLSLIPGTVGACPIQNIGAYGVEVKSVIENVEAIDLETGKTLTFANQDCEFGYRDSIFKSKYKGKYLITSVIFKLSKKPNIKIGYGDVQKILAENGISNPTPSDVSNAIISIRQSKLPDPKEVGNAGSFFKNPIIPIDLFDNLKQKFDNIPSYPIDNESIKIPAGWIIEKCGWKGFRESNFGVHPNQALVLVNYGGASGKSIHHLAQKIQSDCYEKMGIKLEMEVNVW